MIRLHLIAPTVMTKRFLRLRDQSQRNLILNVSSVAAFVPGPPVSVHFATRAHLFSFSIALHDEFRGTDVRVSCLCPGPTRTAFFGRAGMKQVRLASGWPMQLMEAEDVAAAGYQALKAGMPFVVPGLRNRMFSLAARMAPRSIATQFKRWIMQEVPAAARSECSIRRADLFSRALALSWLNLDLSYSRLVLNYLAVRVGLAMARVRLGRRSPMGVAVEGTLISCRKGRDRDIDDRLKLGARHSAPCMDVPAKRVERLFGVGNSRSGRESCKAPSRLPSEYAQGRLCVDSAPLTGQPAQGFLRLENVAVQ